MATIYKTLGPEDTVLAKTLLYEQIPITGSIVSSSTYLDSNIYNYPHGMFQTVYDYPYASSSANNLFDITIGVARGSAVSASAATLMSKKQAVYNQMAQTLIGNDLTGTILRFDQDGSQGTTSDKLLNVFFLNFSRLLFKDEIKKGSFNLTLGLSSAVAPGTDVFGITGSITDASGSSTYLTNSPVGEYGILYLNSGSANNADKRVGLLFYQAGVAVINSDIFASYAAGTSPSSSISSNSRGQVATTPCSMSGSTAHYSNVSTLFLTGTIQDAASSFRRRIQNVQFQNTTQLNSSIYFVRVNNSEFNYSSNQTYLSGSQILVKGGVKKNPPVSYITTVGLYSPDNELLAVAKLSVPIKKTESESLILRVRLDY